MDILGWVDFASLTVFNNRNTVRMASRRVELIVPLTFAIGMVNTRLAAHIDV